MVKKFQMVPFIPVLLVVHYADGILYRKTKLETISSPKVSISPARYKKILTKEQNPIKRRKGDRR